MLRVRVDDQRSIFNATGSAKVGSITLEYDVQRLLPGGFPPGVYRPLLVPVYANEECIGKVGMKGSLDAPDPKETA